MKKLDLYIIKKFLGTFIFIMALIMSISVVFDASEKLEDFISRNAPVSEILFDYYANFVIFYGSFLSPLLIFIAVLLFTSIMSKRTEIVPILSSGISFKRFMRPYMITAVFLALIALSFNHFLVPSANKTRLEFEEIYSGHGYEITNLQRQTESGEIIFFRRFRSQDNFLREFWLTRRNTETGKTEFVIFANRAFGDSASYNWRLEDYFIRDFRSGGPGHLVEKGNRKDTTFNFTLDIFRQQPEVVATMNYFRLREFIREEKKAGSKNVPFYEIEMHKRSSFPFATLIFVIIGVCLASPKKRGGTWGNIALGLFLVITYMFFDRFTTVAALNVGLDPLVAAWVPNMIYIGIAFYIYRWAPK